MNIMKITPLHLIIHDNISCGTESPRLILANRSFITCCPDWRKKVTDCRAVLRKLRSLGEYCNNKAEMLDGIFTALQHKQATLCL